MIVTILGARPQFIKAAALSREFICNGIEERIVHTGQHYDPRMSDVFFEELGIPKVEHNLHIGSANHGIQTGKMMIAIENYLRTLNSKITAVLVYGDTNSTLAGAIVAAKMHIPVIHVEAGLRSFNRDMPEEINRILTDHIAQLLFCSSETGQNQLAFEGITKNVHVVGDIMQDAVNLFLPMARMPLFKNSKVLLTGKFNLITIHRPANTDNEFELQEILNGIGDLPILNVWPIHPRSNKILSTLKVPDNIIFCEPFSYFEMLYMLSHCEKVITDSGGLQKEAYWLKKPCLTIRPQTEWIETLHNNWNQLCNPNRSEIASLYRKEPKRNSWIQLYGDGNSRKKILGVIKELL